VSSLAMTMAGTTEPLSGDAPSHDTPSTPSPDPGSQDACELGRL
jgi:hypothetical protein